MLFFFSLDSINSSGALEIIAEPIEESAPRGSRTLDLQPARIVSYRV